MDKFVGLMGDSMAHGTLINGTAYGVTGGKGLVRGTVYKIKKGCALVNGIRYGIEFGAPTRINVTKEIQSYNDTYIRVNGGEKISSTQTLEYDAGESVTLYAYAQGFGMAFPGIITINGKEVGRVEDAPYSEYEFDCTGHIVNVIIKDTNWGAVDGGRIDITTE